MTLRLALAPGPDHPLSSAPEERALRIVISGSAGLETRDAVRVEEANYASVHYAPRAALSGATLERSSKTTWCPYKGEAAHFHLKLDDGTRIENTVWSYETPFDHVATLRDLIAFYPDKVELIELG